MNTDDIQSLLVPDAASVRVIDLWPLLEPLVRKKAIETLAYLTHANSEPQRAHLQGIAETLNWIRLQAREIAKRDEESPLRKEG